MIIITVTLQKKVELYELRLCHPYGHRHSPQSCDVGGCEAPPILAGDAGEE